MSVRTWRKAAAACVAAAVIGVVFASCSGGTNAVDQNAGGEFRYVQATAKGSLIATKDRKKAGNVVAQLLTGSGKYSLSQDAGKVVVMNYFASWCPPCQTETPQFDAVYRERKSSNIAFIGVDAKDSPRGKAQSWVQDKGVTFPVIYDPNAKSALQLGNVPIVTLPATVLIDKAGRVAAVYQSPLLPNDLNPMLDKLLAETA
jgi:peroxiredoxin